MGKRSNFKRREADFYPTPRAAVLPLIPYLHGIRTFAEPCCGDGALVRHLEGFGLRCVYAGDIQTGQDALAIDDYGPCGAIITNPPWSRDVMHRLIEHFAGILPTWLLLDADWKQTRQAAPYLPHCSDIVAIGRVKWIEGSKHTGKDNACWYKFDSKHTTGPFFHWRDQSSDNVTPNRRTGMPVTLSSKRYISICASCCLLFDVTRRDQLTCSGACRVRAHRNGEIERLKGHARQFGARVSDMLQARALKMLCHELEPRIKDGSLTLDQAQEEVGRAFDKLVMQGAVSDAGFASYDRETSEADALSPIE